jgi:TM2 domain-containing membrane protein YozV
MFTQSKSIPLFYKKKSLVFICLFFIQTAVFSNSVSSELFAIKDVSLLCNSVSENNSHQMDVFSVERPNPLLQLFRIKQKKNKRIIASVLAFPFPFGMVGLHRIYLGCAPYVPVVYIATVGGVFFILPMVDFCVLLANKDLEKYCNNKNVFMWVD